jgi:hypothetical protein
MILTSIIRKLLDPSVPDHGKVEIAVCIRFIMETFSSEFNTMKMLVLEAMLEALDITTDNLTLSVNLLQNVGLIGVCNEYTLVCLVTALNNESPKIVNSTIECLALLGITSREALRNKMEEFSMLDCTGLAPIKKASIHSLDLILQRLLQEQRDVINEKVSYVDIWRKAIDPRVQGFTVERPNSSFITLVPRKQTKKELEEIEKRNRKWKRKTLLSGIKS